MRKRPTPDRAQFTMLLVVLLLAAIMVASIIQLPWKNDLREIDTESVGTALFMDYWFALIVLALGLAAAILGGIYLGKMEAMQAGPGLREGAEGEVGEGEEPGGNEADGDEPEDFETGRKAGP